MLIFLVALSTVITAIPSIIMIANAGTGGIAQYWDGDSWEDIYPELLIGPGDTVRLRVYDLPPGFNDADLIEFNIAESGWSNDYTSTSIYHPLIEVRESGGIYYTDPIDWTSSVDLAYSNTYTIKYRTNDGFPRGTWVARGRTGDTGPWGGHLHFIPEFAFGTVMALLSLFSGLGIYSKVARAHKK